MGERAWAARATTFLAIVFMAMAFGGSAAAQEDYSRPAPPTVDAITLSTNECEDNNRGPECEKAQVEGKRIVADKADTEATGATQQQPGSVDVPVLGNVLPLTGANIARFVVLAVILIGTGLVIVHRVRRTDSA